MNSVQDLRFASRMIRKKPWFSLAIVLTLALGMGINTTVFSLVNAVLFKPLSFPGGERMVMAWASNSPAGRELAQLSYADFRDLRESSNTFEHLEAFAGQPMNLGESGNPPERYRGARITTGMFDMLGVKPIAGRSLQPADARAGAEPAILIGYGIWADRYAKDPGVIGRAVRVNEKSAVIVGVMPEGLKFPNNEDLWMTVIPDADSEKRSRREYTLVGMLKKGTSIAQAQADLAIIAKRLEKDFPDTNKGYGAIIKTFHEAMNGGQIRLMFILMMGAVGFVLLIACANVANMLLSRAVERTREVSIRAAMGANRWQIVRQLLIESILLSTAGGLCGLFLARFGTDAFGRAVTNVGKPYWVDFSMNYVVFGYCAAITVLAGVLFGLAPALSASRIDLNETLKEGTRTSAGGRGGYLTGTLVVVQFMLALVLLSGAGLMIRSFLVAQNEFARMDARQILLARVTLPQTRYPKAEDRQQFFEKLMPKVAYLPGVHAVSLVSNTPGDGGAPWRFETDEKLIADPQQRPTATGVVANKGYLRLLGLSLLRGRDFEDFDGLPGKEAVIVTQTFSSRFFPNRDPVGKKMRLYDGENKPRPWMTIVGVAPDIRQRNPTEQSKDPVILVPHRFESRSTMAVLMRTQGSPSALTSTLRRQVQEIDRDLPLFDATILEDQFYRQRWFLGVFGSVFLIFAVVATGMAAVGIYAVMANAAIRRTREIGVRMALGADVGSILKLVLGRGVKQLALGIVLGLTAAMAFCRLLGGLLFMVSPNDPVTLVSVTLLLALAGLAATWFPAVRAARLDPVKALRYE